MSGAVVFDSHAFVKRLTAGGFTERQAEVLAKEQAVLLETNLATKADIEEVRADLAAIKGDVETRTAAVEAGLKADIAKVEAALKADIAKVEAALKADIAKVEAGLKADIAKVEAGLKADIAKVERDLSVKMEAIRSGLLKWMFAAMIAQGGLVVALIKLL